MQWPEVLKTGEANYPTTEKGRSSAVVDGLIGWTNCKVGAKPPYEVWTWDGGTRPLSKNNTY